MIDAFPGDASTSSVIVGCERAMARMTPVETIMSPARSCRRKSTRTGARPSRAAFAGRRMSRTRIRIQRRATTLETLETHCQECTLGGSSQRRWQRCAPFHTSLRRHLPSLPNLCRGIHREPHFHTAVVRACHDDAVLRAARSRVGADETAGARERFGDQHSVREVHAAERATVVLSEEHATPTVAIDVVYHVGSKNELVGHTGFAHMFEHVMFTGSGHVPYGLHDKFTEGVGGSNNGRPASTGRATTRPIQRTIWRPRSGSRPIEWAFCSTRSTKRSSARSATS